MNTNTLPATNFNKPNMKKLSPRAHEPTANAEPARIDPRPPKRTTHIGYDHPE